MQAKVFLALRLLLGLFMVVLGINKFFGFIDLPSPDGDGGELMRIYATSGFLKLIGILEFAGGLCLLASKFVPLALTFITAIMFNAAIYHGLHDLPGIGPALLSLLLSLALVYDNKDRFSDLLKA
ncbi:MAG: DoxX family membrane protein [Bacteroidota bacterium]